MFVRLKLRHFSIQALGAALPIFSFSFFLSLLPITLWAQEKLIFALDLIRHGDRTPLDELPKLKVNWPQGKGQLTQKGIEQEYQLGVKFRQKYIEESGLLPQEYDHQTIYVRSTDTDRTLMSAQSVLQGLYPSSKVLPVHTQPLKQDPLIPYQVHTSQNNEITLKHVHTRHDWKGKTQALQPKFKKWSLATGIEIKNLDHVRKIADVLYIHKLHQKPMPKLSPEEIDEIIEAGHWSFVTKYQTPEMGYFARELYSDITKHLEEAKNNTPLKYVLFSAHDVSIMTLMTLLQVPLEQVPPYASHLNIALYEENAQHIVKLTFNDIPVKLPHCNYQNCSLEEWKNLPL